MADKPSIRIKKISSESSGDEILEFFEYRFDPAGFKTIGKSDLPPERKWYFWALGQHYRETDNIYFALEAFSEMVGDQVAPPAWVLEAISAGLSKHLKNPDAELLPNQIGLSGHLYEKFERRKKLAIVMPDFAKLVGDSFCLGKTAAARVVSIKHKTNFAAKTLAKIYREEFQPFYDELNLLPQSLSHDERQRFVESLSPVARRLLKKSPRTFK